MRRCIDFYGFVLPLLKVQRLICGRACREGREGKGDSSGLFFGLFIRHDEPASHGQRHVTAKYHWATCNAWHRGSRFTSGARARMADARARAQKNLCGFENKGIRARRVPQGRLFFPFFFCCPFRLFCARAFVAPHPPSYTALGSRRGALFAFFPGHYCCWSWFFAVLSALPPFQPPLRSPLLVSPNCDDI